MRNRHLSHLVLTASLGGKYLSFLDMSVLNSERLCNPPRATQQMAELGPEIRFARLLNIGLRCLRALVFRGEANLPSKLQMVYWRILSAMTLPLGWITVAQYGVRGRLKDGDRKHWGQTGRTGG